MNKFSILTFCLFTLWVLKLYAQGPDPYRKGSEGSVHIWVSEHGAESGVSFQPYDFDKKQSRSVNEGFQGTYKTIGVGEYDYTKENLQALYGIRWGSDYTWLNWTDANIAALTKSYDPYAGETPLSVDAFRKFYGSWFAMGYPFNSYAIEGQFKVRDMENGTLLTGWGLPEVKDILQLIGQAPSTGNINKDLLNFVGASQSDAPVNHHSEWFENKNTSGLTLTPVGGRSSSPGFLGNEIYAFKKFSKLRLKDENQTFSFYVAGSSYNSYDYHLSQVRYRRAKTDKELGYKMYVDNCNDLVVVYPHDKVTILTELPKGLERGIALRYMNLSQMKVYRKWSEILEEGSKIRQTLPTLPVMEKLAVSPCLEPEIIEADPYEKGAEGSVHIWVSEHGAESGVSFQPYDFDKKQSRSVNEGFQGTYKTIGVGEYDYTKENLQALYGIRWGTDYTWLNWTDANIAALTKSYDPYAGETPLSVDAFRKFYGSWFAMGYPFNSYAIEGQFKVRDRENGTLLTGWGLPELKDILQLIGQAPSTGNVNGDLLNFVGASQSDAPVNHHSEWFENKNTSGLTLTPVGGRSSSPGFLGNEIYAFKKFSKLRLKEENQTFSFYVAGSSYNSYDYHLSQVRYRRAKTDKELGYKMYIDNCTDSVVMYPYNQVTVLTELPKGLERGIALRYTNRGKMKVLKKWSDICQEADRIRSLFTNLPARQSFVYPPCEDNSLPSVSLDQSSLELTQGDSYLLKVSLLPENSPKKQVFWSSSNTAIASVSTGGEVKALSEGNATITVTTEAGNSSASCQVRVKKKESGQEPQPVSRDYTIGFTYDFLGYTISSTDSPEFQDKSEVFFDDNLGQVIKIYPGSTDGRLILGISGSNSHFEGALSIFNMSGNKTLEKLVTKGITELDLSGCTPGIYLFQITANENKISW